MRKKSIFVIICCILSALLFISIFVLSALVSNPSTKIDGPKQILGVEKESGESDKYSYVFGSDTVNGEINWLLETDPEQPLANNNISWKKLDGATGVITWTSHLPIKTYNLVLRAAIKDQSLKNAKLDITLKIEAPALTIIGPTEIDDSNLGYESSEYSLYIGEENVTNDSKYTWVLLTLSNSSGNYESNVNINITANHKIVWNKSLNNNSYKLKLQIIEGENTWDKVIVLTLTRPRIILNYDNVPISNNTINHTYNYSNSGEPTNSKEFTAFGINNVDISNQVLWQTNITSSLNDPDEEAKIHFSNHRFEWLSDIKAGNYTVTLKAGNMQYLDSSTITFRLDVPVVQTKISGSTSTQPVDLSSDFYNIGTTSGNGKYLAGVSTSVYRLYDQNTLLDDMSAQTWEIISDYNFQDTSGLYTLINTVDIWYDNTDYRIHWRTDLLYKATFKLKLRAISNESSHYGWSQPIAITFNVDWGKIDSFFSASDGTVINSINNVFTIQTPFFSGDNINYDTCTSHALYDFNNTNQINIMINDKIDYEIDDIKFCKDVDYDADWNYSKTPNWNGNNVNDITSIPQYSSDILDIEFIDNIFNFKWTYQLIPYYNYRLKILYKNRNQTPATSTFYDETQYFYIDLSFTYDYVKQGATILPFFNLKQPDNWTTVINNSSTSPDWIYYDYPRTTSELPWTSTSNGLKRTITRDSITEAYFTYNNPYRGTTSDPKLTFFPENFLMLFFYKCVNLKRVYIYIHPTYTQPTVGQTQYDRPLQLPFGNKHVFEDTFNYCTSLTDVMIKYDYLPIFFSQYLFDYTFSFLRMFVDCHNLTGLTMRTPFDIFDIPHYAISDPTTSNMDIIWKNASTEWAFPNLNGVFQYAFVGCTSLKVGNKNNPNDTRIPVVLGGKYNLTQTTATKYNTNGLYYGMFTGCGDGPNDFAAQNNDVINDPNNPNKYGFINPSPIGTTSGNSGNVLIPTNRADYTLNASSVNTPTGRVIDNDEFWIAQEYPIVIAGADVTKFLLKPIYNPNPT